MNTIPLTRTYQATTPGVGEIRFNTDIDQFEIFNGALWSRVGEPVQHWISIPGCPLPGHEYIDVSARVMRWIRETQPVSSWRFENDNPQATNHTRITVNSQLATMIRIKYS